MRAWFSLVSLLPVLGLAGVIAPRQDPEPYDDGNADSPPIDCTLESVSMPNWIIYDPMFTVVGFIEGTDPKTTPMWGDYRFGAHNPGLNYTVNCQILNVTLTPDQFGVDGHWYNCNDSITQFQFTLKTYETVMKQSWTCDNSPNLKFDAMGTAEMPLILGCMDDNTTRGYEISCIFGDTQIMANLSSPVDITPVQPWIPYSQDGYEDTCVMRSDFPMWTIEDFSYDHAMPRKHVGESEASFPQLTFNLLNLQNFVTLECSLAINDGLTDSVTHPQQWVNCVAPEGKTNVDVVKTTVLFDRTYNLLAINQTWKCHDNDPTVGEGDTYSGLGYLVTPFNCTNPSDNQALSSSYSCSLPVMNITGWSEPPSVPHTAWERSCTLNSLKTATLELKSYEAGTSGASFELYNPGSGDTYSLSDMAIPTSGAWTPCVAGMGSQLPWQLASCSYSLDHASGTLGFKLGWYCDDRDPYHPILFSATASGSLPKSAANDTSLKVSSLTWTSSSKPMDRGPPLPWV